MLRGSSIAKIDDKGRLKFPSGFRKAFSESWGPDVFITSVRGDSGLIYPLPIWESIEAKLLELPSSDQGRQRFLERVSYYGQQARLDAQGRIVVPPLLRERAAIEDEVVVSGLLDHLQIWNRERFERRLDDRPFTDDDFDALGVKGV